MQSESKKALIADDNRVMLNIVRFNLERAGFAVSVARDGLEAWNLLQSGDFDLLITDYKMPKMNGETLCRRMREDASLRNVPVILLSARGLELDLDQLREQLGLYDVIFKPFSPSALMATVEACLKEKVHIS
ncbi:unnamed protein product [marine sediment metagenome]|uniref:Response regulatory domain-containing protein n=1 Tax=marine sediment metagenome TaxID=412755 RepID=X0UT25_9ZZZZ